MYCRHLALANFRSFVRLDLELPAHLGVFWGENGQGKSNLLESLYLLATSRSYRTSAERELVNWYVEAEPAFARVAGEVVRRHGLTRLEVVLAEPPGAAPAPPDRETPRAPAAGQPPLASVRRRVRINGQPKPPAELLGHLNVVLFSPLDVDLIAGPAEARRRYLHITLCQVDHRYLRTLRRYQRVLLQRNALLRGLRERPARPDQLGYWDSQLVELGAELTLAHLRAIALLNGQLRELYPRLSNEPAPLRALYRSTVPLGDDLAALGEQAGSTPEGRDEEVLGRLREQFSTHLESIRPRERQQAVTLAGPHRDDIGFCAGDVDLRLFGSRGQQRTAALGLKLAEVGLMQHYTGERPVVLLDDVMSELDPRRRQFLQGVVVEHEQVLITATETGVFTPAFLGDAAVYHVQAGRVRLESAP